MPVNEPARPDSGSDAIWEERAARLAREADAILHTLDLPGALLPLGDARVVGSCATGLLVKPDIDLHVLVPGADLHAALAPVVRLMLDRPEIGEVRISDYRSNAGLKLGVDAYSGDCGPWSIDIMVTDRYERTGFALTDRLRRELTPALRAAIMRIKTYWYEHYSLDGGVSTRIYAAVLDSGVRTPAEFAQYLRTN